MVVPPSFERRMKEFSPVMTTWCGSTICGSAIGNPPFSAGEDTTGPVADPAFGEQTALCGIEVAPLPFPQGQRFQRQRPDGIAVQGHAMVAGGCEHPLHL